jgi:predicted deacetylase
MIKGKYILRFDDICPNMNWGIWESIERILIDTNISPVLAVVPDNRDPQLMIGPEKKDFWERVRQWKARKWTIAMHGHTHVYESNSCGIYGMARRSEFAGIPLDRQRQKLTEAAQIFAREEVVPECWVAPSHSFDRNTVNILRDINISVISDGPGRWPYRDRSGMLWLPQQLWNKIVPKSNGVWTICYHHNHWANLQVDNLRRDIEAFRKQISHVADIVKQFTSRSLSVGDMFYQSVYKLRRSLYNT